MNQLKLDFSRVVKPLDAEKKTELISFRTGEKFKRDLITIAQAKDVDLAELIFEYAINGYLDDYKNIMLFQMHGEKTVRDLLSRNG